MSEVPLAQKIQQAKLKLMDALIDIGITEARESMISEFELVIEESTNTKSETGES